ncbi:MAG: alpha-glucuronidase [Treponema sp.]|nr:alpha-glucuronidase [Treponema sp.]
MSMNQYNCWLQERIVQKPADLALDSVYVLKDGVKKNGPVACRAAEEFRAGIKRLLGFSPAVYEITAADYSDSKYGVYLGTLADFKNKSIYGKQFNPAADDPGEDGFLIKSDGKNLIIAGAGETGLLYGVFRFLMLLGLGRASGQIEIKEEPASPLRIINHWDNIDGTVGRGYAGRSLFFENNNFEYDKDRIIDYARLLASIGINRIAISNVNVGKLEKCFITEQYLGELAKVAAIFRPFGIKLILSVSFAAPWSVGKLPTADPLDPDVIKWWKVQTDLVYKFIPDLAGYIVKADSEGEPGPFQYHRTQADGANLLARALKPHGGIMFWRCFVYNCQQDWRDQSQDRARAAYDHFMPLDGKFDDNVILQIKFGPYDFQVREPVSPLFGALKKTRHIMELQITQEYTGHQIDLCYLPWIWQDIMNFDTAYGPDSRIRDLIGKKFGSTAAGGAGSASIEGFASIVNTGRDINWTGHTLAQANLYGYGRIIWNPGLSAGEIAREWSVLTFGPGPAAQTVEELQLKSYPAYQKYNAPFGVCFMVTPGLHYGPNVEGYEFDRWGTYHRADTQAIGIDRTQAGTGFTNQYPQSNAAMFADPLKCPEDLILFFHRLRYDFKMKNSETLLQNIYSTHFEGYDEVQAMLEKWISLEGSIDEEIYSSVLARFKRQLANAREWRDQVNTYFWRRTGIPDKYGRKIYD